MFQRKIKNKCLNKQTTVKEDIHVLVTHHIKQNVSYLAFGYNMVSIRSYGPGNKQQMS